MPLTVRNSAQRRKRKPDEKLPERAGESTASGQVMAPTRMKLRVRRRDGAAAARGGVPLEEEEEEERRPEISSGRRKISNKSSSSAAASSSSSAPTPSASASVRAVMAAEDASPDSKCPICLDRFNNLAYLDRCLHRFCFPCIQEWSHNKAECPLCKQPFASILHSVRAENDFKEYTLRPAPANSSVAATVAMVAAMASAARSDHQMRLMLRRHRVGEGGETLTRRRRRERAGRGEAARSVEDVSEDSEEEDREQQSANLSERGVIFETGLEGAAAPVAPNDRASRRLMARLAARQRQQREGGTVRRLRERETVAFRRTLYRCGIRVRGVAGVNGNPGQQQRDITAESFCRNSTLLNRLRPWLRRELTVLYGAHGSLVDIVHRIIMARLTRHGLEDTSTIEGELRQFLLARTEHFVHELVNFARSPLSMDSYDLQAVYEPPAAALELDGVSSSSESSSVIAISEGEEEQRRAGGRSEERAGGASDDVIQTGSCLSLSGWDDETPGPSYSTAEQVCSLAPLSFSPAPQQAASEERGEKLEEEEEEGECLIVGYKKPIAERTPELVQLSSDTEEEKEKAAEEVSPLPSTATALSHLPTIPPSTSASFREEQEDRQTEEVVKEGGQPSRARSWSGSSGRSRSSVCLLSPPTPGEGAPRRERASWRNRKSSSEAASEKRRRKRRRRERERSSDCLRKSGTLYNPNRSIYPAMMLRRSHSSSPFHSTDESGSPEPPSPADSSWEYHCSQVSPLTSSVSSPSHSSSSSQLSSSPLPSSPPPQTPPTPSLSPSSKAHHGEKPGGKRKYKSRHLDSDKDPTWRPSSGNSMEKKRERRRRDGGRRRERQRRDAHSYGGESSSRKSREDRSPSVEIIYEGTVTTAPPAHKRRRRRHRKPPHSSSPVIITLDSDDDNKHSCSSSPLSSQQTVDFSDLPPLPLVHSAGMGGALDAEIGELPVDILDRESDGSTAIDPIAIDNSDAEVDVENHDEAPPPHILRPHAADSQPMAAEQSDSALLAAVLDDLKGLCPPKPEPSLNQEDGRQDGRSAEPSQAAVTDQLPGCASLRSPPPLERCEAPPLLTQTSPVSPHSRNTPPPLKHRDTRSPRQLLVSESTAPPAVPAGACSEAPPTHYPDCELTGSRSDHTDFNHSPASELHSSCAEFPASDRRPVCPRPARSEDRTALSPSVCRDKTESSHSSQAAAFSGLTSNLMSPPLDSRTQSPPSPSDSPSGLPAAPPPAPSSSSSPALHPGSHKPPADLHLSSTAEDPTGRKTLSVPNHRDASPTPPPPAASTRTHLNHSALCPAPSEVFLSCQSKQSADLHPPQTKHLHADNHVPPPPEPAENHCSSSISSAHWSADTHSSM